MVKNPPASAGNARDAGLIPVSAPEVFRGEIHDDLIFKEFSSGEVFMYMSTY